MNRWKNFAIEWVVKFKGPLLVVKYEDLQADTIGEVFRILEFLKFDYDEESVKCAASQEYRFVTMKSHYIAFLSGWLPWNIVM